MILKRITVPLAGLARRPATPGFHGTVGVMATLIVMATLTLEPAVAEKTDLRPTTRDLAGGALPNRDEGGSRVPGATNPADGRFTGKAPASGRPLTLWYRQPANRWLEALPVGNGRAGAMIFGGVLEEKLALNEVTFWSGAPSDL